MHAHVSREDLAVYCHLDDGPLLDYAETLAITQGHRLERKGCVYTMDNAGIYELAIKALTLHELDNPGQKIPQGIQDMINELKIVKPRRNIYGG